MIFNETKLTEENRKSSREFQVNETEKAIMKTAESMGIKEWKEILDFNRAGFSGKKFIEGAYAVSNKRMMESQAELAFGQLLRAGVQNTFNDIYQKVDVVYHALVREVTSNKRQEFYAPLERVGFQKQVPKQGNFPETTFKGLDLELINKKSGVIVAFERELFDDDMTGQIAQRASQMGENAAIYEEAYVMAKIANAAADLDGETLGVSQTWSTVYSTTGLHGAGLGVNALADGRLSQGKIEQGYILAQKMKDQSGRPIVVLPKVLAVSPQDIFYAKVLLNSAQGASMSSTASADLGKVGGIMGINPIQNLMSVVVSRFLPDYAAIMVDQGKGFVFQRRDANEIVQENPQSGPAFSQEVFRFKHRARWEADFIDPKFFINLNPGFQST